MRALTFDFWNTLYRYGSSDRAQRAVMLGEILRRAGYERALERLLAANDMAWERWASLWAREHRTEDARFWLERFLEAVDAALPPDLFDEAVGRLEAVVMAPYVHPVEGAPALVQALARHYPLGLISDTALTPGRLIRARLERDGLLVYFTQLTFSDEIGHSKPHPRVFTLTLEALGTTAAESVHIGDIRRTDIAGAYGVGMRAIRFAGVFDDRDERWPEGDAVAFSYAELSDILRQWGGRTA